MRHWNTRVWNWSTVQFGSCVVNEPLVLVHIAAAVPPRPQDGTVSVTVLFTVVSSCVTDCNL